MLSRVGLERSEGIDFILAGTLSVIAGALNAIGFLVAGLFTANMTGNLSLFAEYLAKTELVLAMSFAGLTVTFIGGAGVAAYAIQLGLRYRVRSIHALVIAAEALILLSLGFTLRAQHGTMAETPLVIVLSFVMGLQNAVTTMISGAKVRTTHVSGMATDVGIELATLLGRLAPREEALPKLKLHGLTLVCFATGGIGGAVMFGMLGNSVFIITGVALLVIAGPEIIRSHQR